MASEIFNKNTKITPWEVKITIAMTVFVAVAGLAWAYLFLFW